MLGDAQRGPLPVVEERTRLVLEGRLQLLLADAVAMGGVAGVGLTVDAARRAARDERDERLEGGLDAPRPQDRPRQPREGLQQRRIPGAMVKRLAGTKPMPSSTIRKNGGGGNAWNALTYDPDFNHLYIGTGNGSPWNQKIRSPGGGDNLFLCSIVAVDADTGEYKWHYQTVPGETWDFNSAMEIVSVDLEIGGYPLKTLMHAPKNAFFYVLNRANDSLISAKPFAKVTWASGVERPIEVAGARYEDGEVTIWPGPTGAHNWQAMSWNPKTQLMYFPYHDLTGYYNDTEIRPARWRAKAHELHVGVSYGAEDAPADSGSSGILAWDPILQRAAWKHENPGVINAGTMTTAGNLVFQGLADGRFIAYRATDGKKLWTYDAQHGIAASPILFDREALKRVVHGGERIARGMPKIPSLAEDELVSIQHFVRWRAGLKALQATASEAE